MRSFHNISFNYVFIPATSGVLEIITTYDGEVIVLTDVDINVVGGPNPECTDPSSMPTIEYVVHRDILCGFDFGSIVIGAIGENLVIEVNGVEVSSDDLNQVPPGDYQISVVNTATMCRAYYEQTISISELCENTYLLCTDGLDNDLDGLVDCEDDDCAGDIEISVSIDTHATCSNGLGQITVSSAAHDLSVYQICMGDRCADEQGVISGLAAGDHDLIITTTEGCNVPYTITPEICGNGIDDDGDGYVDCQDLDCILGDSSLFKSNDVCFDLSAELKDEITMLISSSNLTDLCNSKIEDEIILEILSICGNNCSIDNFYEILNDYDKIWVDSSVIKNVRMNCLWNKLAIGSNPLFCETYSNFFGKTDYNLQMVVQDLSGRKASTRKPDESNLILIRFDEDYICDDSIPDLLVLKTILHEGIHAELFRTITSYEEWKAVEPDDYSLSFEAFRRNKDWQHEFMSRWYIQNLSEALASLDGYRFLDPTSSNPLRYYEALAWEGLDWDYGINPNNGEIITSPMTIAWDNKTQVEREEIEQLRAELVNQLMNEESECDVCK